MYFVPTLQEGQLQWQLLLLLLELGLGRQTTVTCTQRVFKTATGRFHQDYICAGPTSRTTPLLKVQLTEAFGKHRTACKLCAHSWTAYSYFKGHSTVGLLRLDYFEDWSFWNWHSERCCAGLGPLPLQSYLLRLGGVTATSATVAPTSTPGTSTLQAFLALPPALSLSASTSRPTRWRLSACRT